MQIPPEGKGEGGAGGNGATGMKLYGAMVLFDFIVPPLSYPPLLFIPPFPSSSSIQSSVAVCPYVLQSPSRQPNRQRAGKYARLLYMIDDC